MIIDIHRAVGTRLKLPHVKASEQGNVVEVTKMNARNSGCAIVKVSADSYMLAGDDSGELYEFNRSSNRSESLTSLHRTFRELRAVINTNCTDPENIRWVTLTYAENMQDTERLYTDFRDFWKRFKRRWPGGEYITVMEPQKRGAWHVHALFIWPDKAPYVPNDELAACWGHGFVMVKALDNVDNIGAYLSAYLGDVEVPMESEKGEVKTLKDGTKKKFIKGARLCLYPPGMKLYRCSRGIKKPVERWLSPEEYETLSQSAALTYANSLELTTETGFTRVIAKEYYNKLRKPEQQGD